MPTSIRHCTRAFDSWFRRSRVTMPHRTRQRLVFLTLRILLSGALVRRRMASTQSSLTPQTTGAPSHERRLRRVLNDPLLPGERRAAPVAPALTARPRARRWVGISAATAQADQLRVVTAARWERGRALPLAGVCWPGPVTPTVSAWERGGQVRDPAAQALPADARGVVGADRAFGGPVFPDPVAAHGWDGLVRGHGQTRWRDRQGRIPSMAQQVAQRGDRWNGAGRVCTDAGWRTARSVARWGRAHVRPWVLVSRLPRRWDLRAIARQRAAMDALFRDGTSRGWRWEARQVRDRAHQEQLVAGRGLATRITLALGAQAAAAERCRPTRRHRRQAWRGRQRVCTLGRAACWQRRWRNDRHSIRWEVSDRDGPAWSAAQRHRHALARTAMGRRAASWPARWNAPKRYGAHMFCPPLNPQAGGGRRLTMHACTHDGSLKVRGTMEAHHWRS